MPFPLGPYAYGNPAAMAGFNIEALKLINQRSSMTGSEKAAWNTFVVQCITDGTWSKFKFVWLGMAGAFSDLFVDALAVSTPVNHNFVSGDFLASGGCAGLRGNVSATAYIDTGYQVNALSANDTSLVLLLRSNYRTNSAHGTRLTENAKLAVYPFGDAKYYSDQYDNSFGRTSATVSSRSYGFVVATRTASNNHRIVQDGNILVTSAIGAGSLPANNAYIFNINTDTLYSKDIVALTIIGQGLSATDVTNLTNAAAALENSLTINGWGIYMFPTFNTVVSSTTGTLSMLTSNDGIQWGERRNVSFTPSSPDASSGDYSIFKHTDGFYYMAYTRTRTPTQVVTSIGLSRSTDALTWTNLTDIDCSTIVGITRAWAPDWLVDPADNSVNMVFAGSLVGGASGPFSPYFVTLSGASLVTRTTPTLMTGFGVTNYGDPFPIVVSGVYYMWVAKDFPGLIEVYSASSFNGIYTALRTGDWMGIGTNLEGPSLILINGVWRLYFDRVGSNGEAYAEQTAGNWMSGSTTWTAIQTMQLPFVARHGSIIATPP